MKGKLLVQTSERSGLPFVVLPDVAMWDLTQYIATHGNGANFSCSFSNNGFEVSIFGMDEEEVKNLVDQWWQSVEQKMEAFLAI